MAVITQLIKNWVAGISQQPPILRHPEQLEEQLNGFSTEAGGLQKRPPTLHRFRLGAVLGNNINPKVHIVNRDNAEQYIMLFNGTDVEVFDIKTGKKMTVNMQNNDNYLISGDPRNNLKAITIADYTFVVNRGIKAEMSSETSNNIWNTQGALINVKSGQYGRTYRIVVNGTQIASYTTPDGSQTSDVKAIDTNAIVSQLASQCATSNYGVQQGSSWLYLQGGTGETQTVTYTKYPSRTPQGEADYLVSRFKQVQTYFFDSVSGGDGGDEIWRWSPVNATVESVSGTSCSIRLGIISASSLDGGTNTNLFNSILSEANNDLWTETHVDGVTNTTQGAIYTFTQRPTQVTETRQISASKLNTCEVYDGYNNQAMFSIMKSTQKFTNLPASAPNGFTTKIVGENKSDSDDYYVRYDSSEQVWKETIKPGINISYNKAVMPHVLVREQNGTFTFRQGEWTNRDVGDDDSNPVPSFIGDTINDVFFFRNRLGFLSGENIILSSNSDFFNFFMQSAVAVQDTDPIDLAVSDNKVSTLYQAVPFGEDLVLFATDTQFAMRVDGVLTPTNAKVDTMTNFTSDPDVRPVGAGRNIYFTAQRSQYTSVKEYFTAFDNTDKRDAQDITAHVPNYIPNGVFNIMSSTIDNMLLLLTDGEPNSIYVYKYLFIDGQKQQSSWSKWDLGADIVGGSFIGSTLYLVVKREGTYCLESLTVAYNTTDFSVEPYRFYMDRKVSTGVIPASAYDSVACTTKLNLASYYGVSTLDKGTYIVATSKGVLYTTDTSTIEIAGDLSNTTCIVGRAYTFKMTLSTIMIKKTDQGITETTSDGRLQLQKVWFNYKDTGNFNVTVDVNDVTHEYILSSYRFNDNDKFDVLHLKSGTYNIPVQARNTKVSIDLTSKLPTPVAITGGGWNGRYVRWSKLV